MITITHGRATLTVQPENAQAVHDLLALVDKSKGAKGRKFKKSSDPSMKRFYPVFEPGMTTAEYVKLYALQNDRLHLAKVNYEHADRRAPMLDPSTPEVVCDE